MENQRSKEDAETNTGDVALNADRQNDLQVERLRAGDLRNAGNENEGNEAGSAFVEKVRDEIVEVLGERRLALATIAGRMGVSGRTLQRRLTENGRKFKTMVVEVRIEQAREHLLNPSLSITEIAKRLGYGDVSSFDHAFRRSAGVSPRQWRALNKPRS
jgi:AraC-like DNA-binding protein